VKQAKARVVLQFLKDSAETGARQYEKGSSAQACDRRFEQSDTVVDPRFLLRRLGLDRALPAVLRRARLPVRGHIAARARPITRQPRIRVLCRLRHRRRRGGREPRAYVGHSLGGLVAQHVAAAGRPVSGLVMLASTPPSGLGLCSLHMMARFPDVLLQLWLLQNLGAAAVSAPAMHRALFSPDTPLAVVEAMVPRLQRESNSVMFELLAPPRLRPRIDGAVPALVVGGDADKFLPVRAFDEAAEF